MSELTRRQIEYILENMHKKSKKEIAKELGIEKRFVSKFIKDTNKKSQTQTCPPRKQLFFINKIAEKITPLNRPILYIISIFLIAFIIRVIYIQQYSHTYFFVPFKGGYDDYIFDNWAQEILRGNWLGDRIIYIYRMPLYVYVLSFIYHLFGHSYWAVYFLHSLIGSLACVLVYLIGRLYFDKITGFIAGIITALYGPLLFYNGMIVGETLGIFIICLSFIFLLLFQKTQKIYYLFLGGLSIGLSMLIRGNILVVLPFIVLWLFIFFHTKKITKLISYVFVFVIGIILATSPILIRNYIYERDFVPVTAIGGLNIYIGNAYGADGRYRTVENISNNAEGMIRSSIEIAEKSAGRKLKPSEVSNYWVTETARSIKEHGHGFLCSLIWKKFMMFWNSYELPDIWDYYFFKDYIPVLNFPLFSFMIIMPLGIAGMYMTWPRRRELSLLYVFILGYMLSLIAVFIASRYRIQVIPFLVIFAAYAIAHLKDILRRERNKAIVIGVILIGAIIFSNFNIERITFETSYNGLAILLKRSGKMEEAIKVYNKAIEIAPNYPSPYYNLGILYRDIGQRDLAVSYFKKAVEIAPDYIPARHELERIQGGA